MRVPSCSADQLHGNGNVINCCAQAAVPFEKCNTSSVSTVLLNNYVLRLQSVSSTVQLRTKKLKKTQMFSQSHEGMSRKVLKSNINIVLISLIYHN